MKYKSIIILIALSAFLQASCTKEQLCNFLADADLLSDIDLPVNSIIIGEVASAVNIVSNLAAEVIDCENTSTKDAPESNSLFNILYRENENSEWELIPEYKDLLLLIQSLTENEKDSLEISYLFSQAGQYKWSTFADIKEEVIERDEENNEFSIEGRSVLNTKMRNNYFESEILTVKPKFGLTKIKDAPQVKIIAINRING